MISYGLMLIGIVLLVRQEYVAAIMAICLGSGFWLSIDTDSTTWQRSLAITLILTSFTLLIVQFVQIGIDALS